MNIRVFQKYDIRGYRYICFLVVASILSFTANAQEAVVKVWPDGAPGAIASKHYKEKYFSKRYEHGWITCSNNAELFVYLPEENNAPHSAVIVCPGGGYGLLAINKEGHYIAKALAERGVVGIVLKYRLPSDKIMTDQSIGPLQDAQEAIRIVRRRADEWKIDPAKVGIMGFSAGGHLAITLATHYNDNVYEVADSVDARPDFVVPVYPVVTMDKSYTHKGSYENLLSKHSTDKKISRFSGELNVSASTPPTYLIHCKDDDVVPVKNSLVYYDVLQQNAIPSKLVLFEKGGHGFGLYVNKKTDETWIDKCIEWFQNT